MTKNEITSLKRKTDFPAFLQLPTNQSDNMSLGRVIAHEDLRHDMQLCKTVKDRFRVIQSEYAGRLRLNKLGIRHKSKVMLYGKPGCGKTMGAELLAREAGLPLYKVSFDSLIDSRLGATGSNLRSIFDFASKNPCVMLIDECDTIAISRDRNDIGEMIRITNMFLILLDEYDGDGLIVATTNLDRVLDKAIYRRFDDIIHIGLPNYETILEMANSMFKNHKLSSEVDLSMISEKLVGHSHAIVNRVCNDAIKEMILGGHKTVSLEMILNQIENIYQEPTQ